MSANSFTGGVIDTKSQLLFNALPVIRCVTRCAAHVSCAGCMCASLYATVARGVQRGVPGGEHVDGPRRECCERPAAEDTSVRTASPRLARG
jgi:hypothetical protein